MRPGFRQGAGVGSDIATEMFVLTNQRLDFRHYRQSAAQNIGALQRAGVGAHDHRRHWLIGQKSPCFPDLSGAQVGDRGIFDPWILAGGAKDDIEFGLAMADNIHELTPGLG